MDLSREGLIERLLKEGKITQDDAFLLRRKEVQEIPLPSLPKIGSNPKQDWINQELERRRTHAEICGCNPANGGSGICGCTLGGNVVYC